MVVRACASHNLSSIIFLILARLFTLSLSSSLPFVFLHGLGESCTGTKISSFTEHLRLQSDREGYCMEVGDGKRDSWLMPLGKQIEIVCEQVVQASCGARDDIWVKDIEALGDGYNLVGYSQGNMVARGLIEFCDGAPKVNNYISIAGPHAGIASFPYCEILESDMQLGQLCEIINHLMEQLGVYNDLVQKHVAPSGYIKIPNDKESYLRGSQFLPYVNNEITDRMNTKYKERFGSLEKLVLVMFENDKVLVPRETSWFGFYSDDDVSGKFEPLLANQTKLYREDWIGLKTLDEAGKVKFFSVPGGHGSLDSTLLLNYVVPYLKAP